MLSMYEGLDNDYNTFTRRGNYHYFLTLLFYRENLGFLIFYDRYGFWMSFISPHAVFTHKGKASYLFKILRYHAKQDKI